MASSIDHDNIVDVVSFDVTEEGEVFIVMELLSGTSLADALERGPLSLERAILIATQVCRALEAAHERGIIHRDLKPENVFLVRKQGGDFVKVLDFGISKIRSADSEQVRMTRTGQLVGTPLYMSPEQARGEPEIDRRADVYALGVMLYEMLTGTPPFEGSNYFQLLWKHGNEAPAPPSERRPEAAIPPALEAVILRALSKRPSERHGTMAELESELLAAVPDLNPAERLYSSTPGAQARSLRATADSEAIVLPKRRLRGLVSAAAALVLVVGLGTWWIGRLSRDEVNSAAEPSPARPAASAPTETPVRPAVNSAPPAVSALPPGVSPPKTVRMQFASEPPRAVVAIDGAEVGLTPIDLPVLEDGKEHVVVFSLARHASVQRTFRPTGGALLSVRLERLPGRHGDKNNLPIKLIH